MIVLALILLAVAIFLVVAAAMEGSGTVTIEAFDYSVDTTVLGVYIGGLATGVLVLGGVVLLVVGIRQSQARRREIEYLRERVAERDRIDPADDPSETSGGFPPAGGGWPEQRLARRSHPADL